MRLNVFLVMEENVNPWLPIAEFESRPSFEVWVDEHRMPTLDELFPPTSITLPNGETIGIGFFEYKEHGKIPEISFMAFESGKWFFDGTVKGKLDVAFATPHGSFVRVKAI